MKYKKEITTGIVFVVIQFCISCGIFVTYPQMAAYAVSKDTMELVLIKLNKIENKLDTLMIARGTDVQRNNTTLDGRKL